MEIDDILKSNREKILGFIQYINKSTKETTARLVKDVKFCNLVVCWKSLKQNGIEKGVYFYNTTPDEENYINNNGSFHLTSLNNYDTYIDQIKSIDNQLVVIQYMIFDVKKCSFLSNEDRNKAVDYLEVLKEKCLYSHKTQKTPDTTPEQKNFHSNKTDEELRAIFDNLVKGGYIDKDTNIDDWLMLCTGRNITRTINAIQWLKSNVLLALLIAEAFENQFAIAETYFIKKDGTKINGLSQTLYNATGARKLEQNKEAISKLL